MVISVQEMTVGIHVSPVPTMIRLVGRVAEISTTPKVGK
jgi:hypothetical protein